MNYPFTEQDTEAFYDAEDALYRSFWDSEGSLHWGWFDQETGDNFLDACANLNRVMVEKAGIQPSSIVLDLGCGNGNAAAWLSKTSGCRVTGVDLSGVRINNANELLKSQPADVQGRLAFKKASATDLPFDEGTFSHVWSQATIYHVHEKDKALQEAYRVLSEGGIMVFDDLTKPKPIVSEEARRFVYDRLLFDTPYSFTSYQEALENTGFKLLDAHDLSQHLKQSYQCLGRMAEAKCNEGNNDHLQSLPLAYAKMVEAIERGELGWGLYVCQK